MKGSGVAGLAFLALENFGSYRKETAIAQSNRAGRKREPQTKVNRLITAATVRVINFDDEQLGVIELEDALSRAEENGMDLVEVAPNADPPVCRIMDYGQFKYQQSKRQHEAKKHQKIILVKEVKFRPKTEEHDFNFKVRHAISFLEEGNKVKVTVMFRGREMSHRELGRNILDRVIESIDEIAAVESPAKMEGRSMTMVLAPHKTKG